MIAAVYQLKFDSWENKMIFYFISSHSPLRICFLIEKCDDGNDYEDCHNYCE